MLRGGPRHVEPLKRLRQTALDVVMVPENAGKHVSGTLEALRNSCMWRASVESLKVLWLANSRCFGELANMSYIPLISTYSVILHQIIFSYIILYYIILYLVLYTIVICSLLYYIVYVSQYTCAGTWSLCRLDHLLTAYHHREHRPHRASLPGRTGSPGVRQYMLGG